MDKRDSIIEAASKIFEANGFRGTGVDAVLAPSGVSTRTLYKHFSSRGELVQAVLEKRHRQFMQRLEDTEPDDPVGDIFDQLEQWLDEHGARGCMLLRARSEYAGASPEIVALVRRQKQEFEREIARRIALSLGQENPSLTMQVWLLFEGATAAASVSENAVVRQAKQAAKALLAMARGQAK
ncbi:TetR/AcrR family transcriptional regulator [Devosia submarina]|uniref:TetR/AcrR family transcriptional regulator n=1 Tax=Devosia submarina TaxID=1173082 RepID=UPI000D38A22E|nr:TetR/AcrR family transcriptional regulator [Devosia submarina]